MLEQAGTVSGITSRGIFLHLKSGWVIFLSSEEYRGPLTINLQGDVQGLRALEPGTPVKIQAGQLHCAAAGLIIHTSEAAQWETPPKPLTMLSAEKRKTQLISLARQVLVARKAEGLCALLAMLLDLPNDYGDHDQIEVQITPAIKSLQQALVSYQAAQVTMALEPFLGLGAGLTPSGDDLAIGLLLALNRWGNLLKPVLEIEELNRIVVQIAYSRTTTLSANLIECATLGQADERLVFALDGLLSGRPGLEICAANLLAWGNSSGCDALVGMALAIA
jgi:hypothetical protein